MPSMPMFSDQLQKKPIQSLHGLRGIAVLYVLFSHLGNAGLSLFPLPHNAIGKVGVWIFFALSAFLLTHNMIQGLNRKQAPIGEVVRFVIHRIFRIYPLYLVVLLLHVMFADLAWSEFALHIILLEGKGELWAIPVELAYYLLIPIIAFSSTWCAARWVRVGILFLIVASFVSGLRNPSVVFSNELDLLPKLVPFLMGSLLALFNGKEFQAMQPTEDVKDSVVSVLSVVGLVACTFFYREVFTNGLNAEVAPVLSLALSFSVFGLLYSAIYSSSFRALLSLSPLVKLGEISFSIYLLHMFFINGVKSFGAHPVWLQSWGCVFLVIVASGVSYRFIEKPGIQFGSLLAKKVGARL